MELKSLTLTNVRNFDSETFTFTGNKEIVLPNRGGKSTIADAITFLLIGKLNSGSSDIASLKPIKDTSLEVIVEAIFEDASGNDLELKKLYKENWVKTRGSNDVELKGHTTTCYLNEKQMTVTNFEKELCGYFNVDSIKELNIMLNPYYFSQVLSWQERLEYIQKVTGAITVADVIDCAPSTRELESDLNKYDIETLSKKLKRDIADKKELVRDLNIQLKGDQIEVVITKEQYEKATKEYDENLSDITNMRVEAKGINNPTLDKLKEQREETMTQFHKSKEADREELAKKNSTINKQVDDLRTEKQEVIKIKNQVETEIYSMKKDIESLQNEIKSNERLISMKNAEKGKLVNDWKEWKAKEFKASEAHKCPSCGFDLSAEDNQEKENHFNEEKANKLKSITSNGNQLKLEIIDATKGIDEARDKIKLIQETIEAKNKEVEEYLKTNEKLSKQIDEIELKKVYSFTSDITKELKKKLEAIEENIEKESNKSFDDGGIQKQIDIITERQSELKKIINEFDAQQVLIKRKKQREQELMNANMKLSDAEYSEDLLKLYTKTYLEILNARLAQHFPGITFMMVEENIKADSWNQTCYVMVDSEQGQVPYETANTESKIKIGVKLANLLSEAMGWEKSPMVIDNAEAVTRSNRSFDTDAQLITLIADDIDYNFEQTNNERIQGQQALEI